MTRIKTITKPVAAVCTMCVALAASATEPGVATAQRGAGSLIEQDVLQKLPPDSRAVLESLSPTRTGDDGDRGIALVNREWEFTYGNPDLDNSPALILSEAHPDLDGNIVVGGVSPDAPIITIFKFDGSLNGDAPPGGPIWELDIDVSASGQPNIEIDLDGFIYVHSVRSDGTRSVVLKIAPSGGNPLWSVDQTGAASGGTDGTAGMAIDPDGTPFVAFRSSSTAITVRRIDALSGAIAWQTDIEGSDVGGGDCVPGVPFTNAPKIITDKQGDLWVTTTGQNGSHSAQFIWQVDAVSGRIIQCGAVLPDEPMTLSLLDFVLAPDGRFLSCGTTGPDIVGEDSYLSSFEGDLSQPAVHRVGGFGARRFNELQVDRMGRVHALGRSDDGNYLKYLRLTGPEFVVESVTPNSPEYQTSNSALAIDRIGNPYIILSDASDGSVRTLKLNGVNNMAEIVWEQSTEYAGYLTFPSHLIVDAGGNVYSVTNSVVSGTNEWFGAVTKDSQPYLSVPIAYSFNPKFQLEEAGLWSPDDPSFVYEYDFFDTGTVAFDTTLGDTFEVCYVFDCDDFGAEFGVDFDARLQTGFRAEANGGSFDAVVPVRIKMLVPSDEKLFPGQPIKSPIVTSWNMDPASRLTAAGTPTFNAGVTGELSGGLELDYDVTVFSDRLVGGEIFDERLQLGPGYIPVLNIQSLIHAFIGDDFTPGYTYEFEDQRGFFGGDVRYPDLSAQGVFEQTATGGIATSNAEDLLLELRANISEMAAAAAGATISLGDEYEYAGMNLEWEAAILQLILRARLNLLQDIEVEFNTPEIEFAFSDGVASQTITAGDPITFVMPADGNVVITPTARMSATVRNTTGLNLVPGGSFTPVEASAEIYYDAVIDEFELYSFNIEDWVPSIDVNAAPIGPLDLYTDEWTINFPPVEMPPIIMTTENQAAPNLSAASRESVNMMIYDQTNPLVSQYNVLTSGSFKMLLYGDGLKFGAAYNDSLVVHIAHQGAEVLLTKQNGLRTLINRNTMLIEIPNYLRVIPGVARVWVTADGKVSETLDLAINYPRPRLDTVNPNLWAADPALLEVPVSVIDGQSTIGQDTFIARRDYFVKLRDEFWNEARVGGVPADDFFSLFDFEQLPGFPLVLFDGKPLPRFEQPTDSGILNVRLPPSNYAAPGLVDVMLCNPGPGGGPSIVRQLNIAAPRPVLTSIEPSLVAPDEGPVVMTLRGPSNVPFDPFNEEPKYGNFTADTQVYVDGVVVGGPGMPGVTRVNGPGSITVELDTTDLQDGLVLIQAFTPANGSQYLEQVIDPNSGEPGLGLVDSGGLSAPIYLEVGFPRPEIARLVPPSTTVNSVRMLEPTLTHNLSIVGDYFRDDAVVYVNGQPRTTIFEGDGLVRVLLEPLDLAMPGMIQVAVESGGDVSTPAFFFINPAP